MIRRSVYFLEEKAIERLDDETKGKNVSGILKVRRVRGLHKGFIQTRNVTCNCMNFFVQTVQTKTMWMVGKLCTFAKKVIADINQKHNASCIQIKCKSRNRRMRKK
jgi:hypothetical protein